MRKGAENFERQIGFKSRRDDRRERGVGGKGGGGVEAALSLRKPHSILLLPWKQGTLLSRRPRLAVCE